MPLYFFFFFFFNDTAPTEIYTLSLHDALPTSPPRPPAADAGSAAIAWAAEGAEAAARVARGEDGRDGARKFGTPPPSPMFAPAPTRRPGLARSEEHTSELQYLESRMPSSSCRK